jgi:hypothetical protein
MISKIKLSIATAFLSLIAACGGGGDSGSSGGVTVTIPPPAAVDPKITVYSTFDLSNSMLSGNSSLDGVLQNCIPTATQINLMLFKLNQTTKTTVQYNFILDGTFNLPNSMTCSTTGITGVITGVTLMVGNNPAYTISSLAIDAGSFKYGQQIFWANILKQTGKLINTQSTSSQITCTDSTGKGWYTPLNSVGDISNFFATCAK